MNYLDNDKIWLSPPHLGDQELIQVTDAINSNWIAPIGPHIDRFERQLCELTGAKHAVALSSGTAALHLALIMLGVEQGDEVMVSSLTFAASVYPIIYQKAVPIFIDCENTTANMSPDLLEDAIKERVALGKKVKAIVLVHLYGMPAQIEAIQDIADRYGIPIIEDAAEALGSTYKNQMVGTFGKLGFYSFNGNKIITTSGGGCLTSDDHRLIEKAKKLSSQARDPAPHYQHSEIGFNYRMSNICAAIGIGQLEVLAQRVAQRRSNFYYYKRELGDIEAIQFISEPDSNYFSNHWLTWIKINHNLATQATPDKIRTSLEKRNIEARPLWKPMHLQPVFSGYPYFSNGCSEIFFNNSLCLPSGSNLIKGQLNRIVDVIRGIF